MSTAIVTPQSALDAYYIIFRFYPKKCHNQSSRIELYYRTKHHLERKYSFGFR